MTGLTVLLLLMWSQLSGQAASSYSPEAGQDTFLSFSHCVQPVYQGRFDCRDKSSRRCADCYNTVRPLTPSVLVEPVSHAHLYCTQWEDIRAGCGILYQVFLMDTCSNALK